MKYIGYLLFIPVPVAIFIASIFLCVAGAIESMDLLNQYDNEWRTSVAAAAYFTIAAFWMINFFGLGAWAVAISDYGDHLLHTHDQLD